MHWRGFGAEGNGGGGDACGLPGDFSRAVALADGGRGEEGHDKNRRDGKEQDTGA